VSPSIVELETCHEFMMAPVHFPVCDFASDRTNDMQATKDYHA
jgi:hypothetical protein